jgi:putative nucleotidyltransferase with HDIG domain
MNEAIRFLKAVARQLSVAGLYRPGHPERERSVDEVYAELSTLLDVEPRPVFAFLEGDVIYADRPISGLRQWEWAVRLAEVGVERLEIEAGVSRSELVGLLEELHARLAPGDDRPFSRESGVGSTIRFGPVSVIGEEKHKSLPTATMGLSLEDELEVAGWLHREVKLTSELPTFEAIAVVQLLSAAMHAEREIILPLVELKEIDEYSAAHSLNVSVLSMGLAESLALPSVDVRTVGEAALLHDVGKTLTPLDVLNKPGKLTEDEWMRMQQHPVEGARILLAAGTRFSEAAIVAYEHHIGWKGDKGYPELHYRRTPHRMSRLVQVCDVYDALRTRRPFRPPWPLARTLRHLETEAGVYLDPEFVSAFLGMIRQWEPRMLDHLGAEQEPAATTETAGAGTP